MTVDLANSDKLLATTRAVRKRLDYDRPVERSVIEDAVEVALQAPNTIPAQFIVVTDPEKRRAMGQIYCEAHLPYLDGVEQEVLPTLNDADAAKFRRYWATARWASKNIHRAPVHVHVAATGRSTYPGYAAASFYGTVLPPAWSFMLALRARGVGASWTTVHLQEQFVERLHGLLELPEDYSLGVFFPCGYYTGEDFKRATRPTVAESIHWEGWQGL